MIPNAIKCPNIFHCKTLQKSPYLGFFIANMQSGNGRKLSIEQDQNIRFEKANVTTHLDKRKRGRITDDVIAIRRKEFGKKQL
jgi:hypothetical protein